MLPVLICLVVGSLVIAIGVQLKDYFRYSLQRLRGALPPGPVAYPFIGTPGIDGDFPWVTMIKWSEEYGPLCTYFLGPQLHLMIGDAELARTLYKDPRLDGRPHSNLRRLFKNHAIAFSEDNTWKELRRFELTTLKDLGRGSGENLIETYVQQATEDLIKDIQDSGDGPFWTNPAILKYVGNSIASVLCGSALRSGDPRFTRLNENVNVIFREGTTPSSILNVFPWLTNFPPFKQQQEGVEKRMDETVEIVQGIIADHKSSFDPNNIRDFIDAFLLEQSRLSDPEKTNFKDVELVYLSIEMYFAGLDATLAALQWTILLVASHPEVQRRCQEEIGEAGGMYSYAERGRLPFCEAAINEVLRLASVDPFGLPHRCTEDIEVGRYVIPKDTTVIVNYYAIHVSPENYPDPWQFKPSRFLDDSGKYAPKPHYLPFATGRRMCSGDNFAKTIVFVAFVALMQRFTFQRIDDVPWTDIKRINGVGVHPDKFLVQRHMR